MERPSDSSMGRMSSKSFSFAHRVGGGWGGDAVQWSVGYGGQAILASVPASRRESD